MNNGILKILDVSTEDMGSYICSVSTQAGSDEASLSLTVIG